MRPIAGMAMLGLSAILLLTLLTRHAIVASPPVEAKYEWETLPALAPLTDAAKREAEVLWAARQDADERLVTGLCSAVGTVTEGKSGIPYTQRYLFAFDHREKTLRFDSHFQDQPQTQVIRSPRETVLHVAGSYIIARDPPNASLGTDEAKPFDVSLVGLYGMGDFTSRRPAEDIFAYLSLEHLVESVREPNGQYRLTFMLKAQGNHKRTMRRAVWLDPRQGFRPVRATAHVQEAQQTNWLIASRSQTTWKERKGAWVPLRMVVARPPYNKCDVSFEWSEVNGPIDSDMFTVAGLHAPVGTSVIDYRLGRPVVESTLTAPSAAPSDVKHTVLEPKRHGRWMTLVALNGVLLVLLATVQWYRYRMRRAHESGERSRSSVLC